MTDPHADLRAMLEALPSLDISVHDGVTATVGSWLLRAPALVRALLEERDALKAEAQRLDDVRTKQIRVLQDIIKNDQTPAGIEVKRLAERADRAEAEIERLRKPSVIRDGFPPDSLLENKAQQKERQEVNP